MMDSAEKLEYERAAELRDRIKRLERRIFGFESAEPGDSVLPRPGAAHSKNGDSNKVNGRRARQADDTLPSGPRRSKGTKSPKRPGRQDRTTSSLKQGRLKLIPDADD
jgi:hypothetical protein